MNELQEAIKQLYAELNLLPLKLALHEGEFQKAVDAEIERHKKKSSKHKVQAIEPVFDEMATYKQSLIDDLEAAIAMATERNIETPASRQLV